VSDQRHREKRPLWQHLLISSVLSAVLFGIITVWQLKIRQSSLVAVSNACFAVAVVWGGIGLMTLISSAGGYSSLGYLMYVFKRKWSRKKDWKTKKMLSYFEFQNDTEPAGAAKPLIVLLLPAAVYLILSIVLGAKA